MSSKRILFISLIFVILTISLQPQWGVDAQSPVYVRENGNDTMCDGTVDADYPGSGGPGLACAFATIQHAVDTVNSGGTVNVASGTYYESDIDINQSVVIIGDPGSTAEPGGEGPGPNAPEINGGGAAQPVFDILADNVTIQGFEIHNVHSTNPGAACGIRYGGSSGTYDNITLTDNYIYDTQWAGIMHWTNSAASTNWQVRRNVVEQGPWSSNTNVYGIELTNVRNSTIAYNHVSGGFQGILVTAQGLSNPAGASNNRVENNRLHGAFASDAMIFLAYSTGANDATLSSITVLNNLFENISGNGIHTYRVFGQGSATISDFSFSGNTFMYSSHSISATMMDLADLEGNNSVVNNGFVFNNPIIGSYMLNLANVRGTISISSNAFTFSGTTPGWAHSINITGSDAGSTTISDNIFDGTSAGDLGTGIRIRNSLPSSASVNITGNIISNYSGVNGRGIRSDDMSNNTPITLFDNCFYDNTFGAYNGGSSITFDADGNFWGDPSGPYHPSLNPGGLGDPVSDDVAFVPWYNTCHNVQPTPTPTPTATNTPIPTPTSGTGLDAELPETGFAPKLFTDLGAQKVHYDVLADSFAAGGGGMVLSIPELGVSSTVLGVPKSTSGWNVRWLGNYIGWLSGTAFPTWKGNSVLTGHIYNNTGDPGVFINLDKLSWGDQIIITAWGQDHIYEVREKVYVKPDDVASVMQHEEQDWLTLLTCYGYDESTGEFTLRLMVRAVRIN